MIALLIVINITIAIAFVAYSYMAATKLQGAGTLLQDGDTEGAGDMLNRAGTMYEHNYSEYHFGNCRCLSVYRSSF
ncbi:MAG: hypothetical protein ACPGYR_01620 [Chitinophagales bacterium]